VTALSGCAVAAVVAPALAALLGLPAGRRSRGAAVAFGFLGALVALISALVEAGLTWSGERAESGVRLLGTALGGDPAAGAPAVDLVVRADDLAGIVGVAVGAVALAVQIYSAGYLHGPGTADAPTRYPAYAATVSVFTAAMMLVVHADDLVLLLVGWEVMGLASYLLVGHHSERPAARAAAVKAFLVTRVGDVGFVLGVVVLLAGAGTSSVTDLLEMASSGGGEVATTTWTLAALLLLAGVVGKSAQFPLHTWLPDAMEGPTPVSALIHAATMVAAGVFVLARLHPVFVAGPAALIVAALIAAVTMLGAALAALAQDDLKRLLAWSTVSQVAVMMAGLAVGTCRRAVRRHVAPAVARSVQGTALPRRRLRRPRRGIQHVAGHGGASPHRARCRRRVRTGPRRPRGPPAAVGLLQQGGGADLRRGGGVARQRRRPAGRGGDRASRRLRNDAGHRDLRRSRGGHRAARPGP
jgi:NADH-quinone oxidoreductase subunit L